jgi:hypothetical protein
MNQESRIKSQESRQWVALSYREMSSWFLNVGS